jgi:ankyrin repeat protein
VDVVTLLLNYGSNVNLRNSKGDTALHISCEHGFIEVIVAIGKYVQY